MNNNFIVVNARFLTQDITGVQRFGIELSRRLKDRLEVKFVSPANVIHLDLADELEAVTFGKTSSHVWEQTELPFYLKRLGSPLLLNFNSVGPIFYSNKIITIHDLSFVRNPEWFSKLYAYYYSTFTPLSARRSKAVLTVSEFSRSEIKRLLKFGDKRIEIIYNAVGFEKPETTKPLIPGKYILTVSSLDPRKNIFALIKAFQKLNRKDIKLVIVGISNKIFNNAEELPDAENIIYWGKANDEDLASLYSNAEMFVFPSLYEGFGIPPLEAMKFGCPTIVSDTASLPEVCADASLYVQPQKIESIEKAITKLLKDNELRKALIQKGFENVKRFSWEKSTDRLTEIIKELRD